MVSNAGIQLCLKVTVCNCMILFIFVPVVSRGMLLADIQYGRL